jgi:hypothetical protein
VEPSEVVPAAVLLVELPVLAPPVIVPPVAPPDTVGPPVEPLDVVPPLAPVAAVEGDVVVLGAVVPEVDAPGDVVSAERRSQPANTAVNAAVASITLENLDIDCIFDSKIIVRIPTGFIVLREQGSWRSLVLTYSGKQDSKENCLVENQLQGAVEAVSVPTLKAHWIRKKQSVFLAMNQIP